MDIIIASLEGKLDSAEVFTVAAFKVAFSMDKGQLKKLADGGSIKIGSIELTLLQLTGDRFDAIRITQIERKEHEKKEVKKATPKKK